MRFKILLVGMAVVLFSGASFAQGVDAFIGYSLLNGDRDVSGRETDQGWMANVSGNITDSFGIVGDVGGHYQDGVDVTEFMGGVRLTNRLFRAQPFFQGLIGGVRVDGASSAQTYFAMGLGGGVDVRAHNHLAIRAIQVDWMPYQVGDDWETSFIRLGFGLTFIWD
jgi:hypothetical protein